MTEREGQLYFVISEWWDQVLTSGDSKDVSIRTLVEYIMELEDEEYEHINNDPHDGWWLRPEYQDPEDEDKRQESN